MPAHGKRRALGQHFLKDQKVIQAIAEKTLELAGLNHCKTLLEIGPGKGAITRPLIKLLAEQKEPREIGEFILAERDPSFALTWRSEATKPIFPVRVEEGDFLNLEDQSFLGTTPLMVVSNLPYSAGTAIVNRLALHPTQIPAMVLMFQAEVAQRLRAEVGTKSWGSLSIWIQNRWDVKRLLAVPPGAFNPPPDVDSEVVVFTARPEPRIKIAPENEKDWDSLLRVCFAHRRKMLRSGLPKSGPWQDALAASQIDGTKRSEALTWGEWEKLFAAVIASHSN